MQYQDFVNTMMDPSFYNCQIFNTRMYTDGLEKYQEIELIKLTKTHLGQTILQHNNTRTCQRPSCHSDHYLLIAVLGPLLR